jgi:ketosteroid isomerase-like protein
MTQESIEIVRAAIEAWNRSDFDAWIGAWDERAEFHPYGCSVEGRGYHGHDGLRRFVAEMTEEWEQVRFEVDEIRGAGEQVVALGRARARGRASGVEGEVPLALAGVVRDKWVVYARSAAMGSRSSLRWSTSGGIAPGPDRNVPTRRRRGGPRRRPG